LPIRYGLADYLRVLFRYTFDADCNGMVVLALLIGVFQVRTGAVITSLFLAVELAALAIVTLAITIRRARSARF